MDAFIKKVQRPFSEPLRQDRLMDMSLKLQVEIRAKLDQSDISMLPTFQHLLPTRKENGYFLAVDVGGSTLRVALVRLSGRTADAAQICSVRVYAVDDAVRQLRGDEFFDWLAAKIAEMKTEAVFQREIGSAQIPLGLTWSFPIEQISQSSGRLLKMGKGFHAGEDIEGHDLSDLLLRACRKLNLDVTLGAIVNDSVATLLSQAYLDPTTRVSLILGTGFNVAVYLPVSALGDAKFGVRPAEWTASATRVVVNTELSMLGRDIMKTTKWDALLNAQHELPDFQPLEYLLTGRYLGEIVRLVLIDAIATAGLFHGRAPHRLAEPYALDTKLLAEFERDASPGLSSARLAFFSAHPFPPDHPPPDVSDLHFIHTVIHAVTQRAAAYLAVALHALWKVRSAAERLDTAIDPEAQISIACDGNIILSYPYFRRNTQQYLNELCQCAGAGIPSMRLEVADDGSIRGAAVAAASLG